ncbi:PDZ domain-containing protein [Kordia sp.]|uniref:PDZ domain-containing protein n=1 Tax=Kordia sp. TaxID=1965332 RepID=UPI003D265A79
MRKKQLLPTVLIKIKIIFIILLLFSHTVYGQSNKEEARGFIGSIASLVYGFAWPTATFERWDINDVSRLSNGLDLKVKFTGKSILGHKLWVVMKFEFRNGSFHDIKVSNHNAVFVEPFALTGALTELMADLLSENSSSSSYSNNSYTNTEKEVLPYYSTRNIKFKNNCGYSVKVWIRYQNEYGNWVTDGVWDIDGNKSFFLSNENSKNIKLSSSVFYYFAEIPDRNYSWHGDYSNYFGDDRLAMRKQILSKDTDGNYFININCNNLSVELPNNEITNKPLIIGILGRNKENSNGFTNVVEVTDVMNGLPAFKSGIQRGDIITHVNNKNVINLKNLQDLVKSHYNKSMEISLVRNSNFHKVNLTPEFYPQRNPIDSKKCRKEGNPNDYYLGAVAVPFTKYGVYVVPRYPNTIGRLFDTNELDIYILHKDSSTVHIYHGKPIRNDIIEFTYIDRDRALIAKLDSGEYLDLGVRIQCLIQPWVIKASKVKLIRTKNSEEISSYTIPLKKD